MIYIYIKINMSLPETQNWSKQLSNWNTRKSSFTNKQASCAVFEVNHIRDLNIFLAYSHDWRSLKSFLKQFSKLCVLTTAEIVSSKFLVWLMFKLLCHKGNADVFVLTHTCNDLASVFLMWDNIWRHIKTCINARHGGEYL